MKIQEAIEEFLFHCTMERGLSSNTTASYASDLRVYKSFIDNNELGEACSVAVLKSYLVFMVQDARFSNATVRRRLACLRSFCRHISQRGSILDPFTEWSPSIKRPKILPRAVAETDVRSLVSFENDMSDECQETIFAVLLFSATGVRVSEYCFIKAKDVSSDGTAIKIHGKGAKERIVYVSDRNIALELSMRKLERTVKEGESTFLFLNSRGNPLKPQTLRRRIHKLRKASGVDSRVTPHMLRHTAATMLIESGTDIRFVQRLLGHSSIATTEIYTHVSDVSLKKAVFQANTISRLTRDRCSPASQ